MSSKVRRSPTVAPNHTLRAAGRWPGAESERMAGRKSTREYLPPPARADAAIYGAGCAALKERHRQLCSLTRRKTRDGTGRALLRQSDSNDPAASQGNSPGQRIEPCSGRATATTYSLQRQNAGQHGSGDEQIR